MRILSFFVCLLLAACSTSPQIPKTDRGGNTPLLTGSLYIESVKGIGSLRTMMNKERADALFEKDDPRVTNSLESAVWDIFDEALGKAGLLAENPSSARYGIRIIFTDSAIWPYDSKVQTRFTSYVEMLDTKTQKVIYSTYTGYAGDVPRMNLSAGEFTRAILIAMKHAIIGTGIKGVAARPGANGRTIITIFRDEAELLGAIEADIIAMRPDAAKTVSALISGFAFANEHAAAQLMGRLVQVDPDNPPQSAGRGGTELIKLPTVDYGN